MKFIQISKTLKLPMDVVTQTLGIIARKGAGLKKEVIGNATLYLGDCLEVMKQMPENSVDAIVTDPPFTGW